MADSAPDLDIEGGGRAGPGRATAVPAGAGPGVGRGAPPGGEDIPLPWPLFGVLLEVADRIEAALAPLPHAAGGPLRPGPPGWLPDLLVERVVPRLRAEEEVLHPALEPDADLASCRREHDRIRGAIEAVSSLVGRLQAGRYPSRSAERVLRDRLRDLRDLLRDHVREEARVCAPALSAMGVERRGELERAMAASEEAARRAVRLVVGRVPDATEAVVLRSNPRAGRAFVVGLGETRSPERDRGPEPT